MRGLLLIVTGILFVSLLQAQEQAGISKTVTLDKRQAPLEEILEEIEEQAGVSFSYESSMIAGLPLVTFKADGLPLENCLKLLFEKLPVQFRINGRIIILKKKVRKVTLNGFVREKVSSESLIGASVYELSTRQGAASNNYGYFSLTLDPGDIELQVSYIGYQPRLLSFPALERDTFVSVELESQAQLAEVVVIAPDPEQQQVLTTRMGTMEMNQQTIRHTPVMFGEPDLIKTLQLTPGVAPGVEGFAGMYVRGGNMDENLFLIDGNPVYQVNHMGGIFSAFNSEAVRGMSFFKAGFPARYGGRLSSVVDVYTKDGNMKEFHGSASIGLISASVSLEGPLIKDRTSFSAAFRRTWMDAITGPMFSIINNRNKDDGYKSGGNYFFHDLNLKVNHHFSDRSRMYVSLYNGRDKMRANYSQHLEESDEDKFLDNRNRTNLVWGNTMATAGWTYVFNHKLFGKMSGFYTQYRSSAKQTNDYESGTEGEKDYLEYKSRAENVTGISDFGVRTSFDYLPSPAHRIRFGGDGIFHRFRPEFSEIATVELDTLRLGSVFTDELFWAREFGVFAEDDWSISPSVRLNAGIRLSLFNVEGKTYLSPEPRVSLRWLLRNDLSLKASYSRMNQYVHLLSTSYVNLPTDAWMPVTDRLKPLVCDHLSAGIYYNLKNKYDFSLEGYYKYFNNLLDFKDGHNSLSGVTSWEDKLTSGTGRGYGMEFMARKQSGKTTGWIGYTLSWSDRKFREIDKGVRFPSRFDNRHKLNIVAMHKLTPKIEISAAWTYATGNRMTLSLEGYEGMIIGPGGDSGYDLHPVYIDYYEQRNNYKLPDYHRLDLGVNFYRPKKNGRMGIWNVSIYNAYCRMNPFMVYKKTDRWLFSSGGGWGNPEGTGGVTDDYRYHSKYKQVSVVPIIPTVTYTYKF